MCPVKTEGAPQWSDHEQVWSPSTYREDPASDPRDPSLDRRHREAAENAAAAEWESSRKYMTSMASAPFGAAEAGARLQWLFARNPSLLCQHGKPSTIANVVGAAGKTEIKPDLLPLPLPHVDTVSADELDRLFHGKLTKEAVSFGAQCWLYNVVLALNTKHAHGKAYKACARASAAQSEALAQLGRLCRIFVSDTSTRTTADCPEQCLFPSGPR